MNEKELAAPSFVFTASFCFSIIWAVAYTDKWDLNLHWNTFSVLGLGVLEINIVTVIIRQLAKKVGGTPKFEYKEIKPIYIERWKKIFSIAFELFTIFYSIKTIIAISVAFGSGGTLQRAMKTYDYLVKFSLEGVHVSKVFTYSRLITRALGYWFLFIFINNYSVGKRVNVIDITIVVLSLINEILTGGRNQAVNMLISIVPFLVFVYQRKKAIRFKLKFKYVFGAAIVLLILLSTFQSVGAAIGGTYERTENALDYLAKYCGAEIKNLDIFLNERYDTMMSKNAIWGSQTFIYMVRWIGPKLGLVNSYYTLDLPFNHVNGYSLGNVYTTFYPYIYDFGYWGMFVLVFLMGVVIQLVYEVYKRATVKKYPPFPVVLYGYMFNSMLLSFFSNKFYEQYFQKSFFTLLVFLGLFPLFFSKVRLKVKLK